MKNVISVINDGIDGGLSFQEISWCETYLKTASVKQACTESAMSLSEANKMLCKEVVKNYLYNKAQKYKVDLETQTTTREDLKNILKRIASDPTTKTIERIQAISKLNDMFQFETINRDIINNNEEDTIDTLENIKISSDEAEKLLKEMRSKCK
jgi:tRNA C32,U32 (ribose-2'-O)-methylase TrmJ